MGKRRRLCAAALTVAVVAALITSATGTGNAATRQAAAGNAAVAIPPDPEDPECSVTIGNPRITGIFRYVSATAVTTCTEYVHTLDMWVWLTHVGTGEAENYVYKSAVTEVKLSAQLPCAYGLYRARAKIQWTIRNFRGSETVVSGDYFVDDCGASM